MAFTTQEETDIRSMLSDYQNAETINDLTEGDGEVGNKEVEYYDPDTGEGGKMAMSDIIKSKADKSHTHTKSEITDFPESLPANGGNSETVNGHTVLSNVPADAVFTDTHNPVDASLSGTSVNAVQNKAVKAELDKKIPLSQKGSANGVAQLDENGHVPISQIPGTVDEIVEGYLSDGKFYTTKNGDDTYSDEVTGASGKIYTDLITNNTFRWSGTQFTEISKSLALGETDSTAYAGDKGKATTDSLNTHLADKDNPHGVTKAQVGLGNVDNTSDANKPISTKTQAALDLKANTSDMTTALASKADQTALDETNKTLSNVKADVTRLYAGSNYYYAVGRVAGATSGTFTKEYGNKDRLTEILSHLRIGLIKDGVPTYFASGRCDIDENGNSVAIDGSEGDVCLITDVNVYSGRNRGTIGDDTNNFMGLGLSQYQVEGLPSMAYQPFFFAADYTVNAKLDGDTRSQAHCIYNESVAGTYSTPVGLFKETYKASGNGYPSQYISSLNASQQARNKNADPNSNSPYQGLFGGWEEIWWQAMYMELGTMDVCDPANFGYGCTNTAADATAFLDTAMSGVSGVKMITSGGTASYGGLMSQNMRVGATGSNQYNLAGLVGTSYYGFLQNLVHLRIFSNIYKNGLTSYVGNSSAVFTDLGASVVTDGSIDLSTGTGMTANTLYMQVRDVPNCQGIADGVMTGVINIYVMMDCADDCYLSDGSTSMKDGKVIFKFSLPVYRGMAFLKGLFTHHEGYYFRHTNTDGTRRMEFWSVDRPENVPVIGTSTGYCDGAELTGILKGLTLRFTKGTNGGWVTDTDYSYSMFAHKTTGSGQHSGEFAYLWNDASWGYGNGYPAQGKSCVNASVRVCYAFAGFAGRSLDANDSATDGVGNYAGAFAGFVKVA